MLGGTSSRESPSARQILRSVLARARAWSSAGVGSVASSDRVSSEVGSGMSCAGLVGVHTPLQVPLNGEPGDTIAPSGSRIGPVVVLYRCSARPPWMRSAAEHRTGTVEGMVRTLDLAEWAGCWVALDTDDRVQRHAATLSELMAVIDADGVEGLEIMRAPVPGEPVVFGLG